MKIPETHRAFGFKKIQCYYSDVLYIRLKAVHVRTYILAVLSILVSNGFSQIQNDTSAEDQISKSVYSYFGFGVGFGNQISFGASLDMLGEANNSAGNRFGLSLCFKGSNFNPANKPPDYAAGLFEIPREGSVMLSAMFVYETPANYPNAHLGVAIGPAYNSIKEIVFTRKSNGGLFGSNYDTDYNRISIIGFLVNVRLRFELAENFGLEVAPFLNYNSHKSLAGVQLNLVLF